MKHSLLTILTLFTTSGVFAQYEPQIRVPATGAGCSCSSSQGCSPIGRPAIQPISRNDSFNRNPRLSTGDRLSRMAHDVRLDLARDYRNERIYDALMRDADQVARALQRLSIEERSGTMRRPAQQVRDALTPLRRIYSAIRDDSLASRSVASVRSLGRELVSLERSLATSPVGRSAAPQRVSIPNDMKGVALLPPDEQVAALSQRVCPVTGGLLGSMGKPILARVAGRSVYVCCQGCIGTLRGNPQKYLARLSSPNGQRSNGTRTRDAALRIPDNMKGIRLLPATEQSVALQQRICPIMKTPLGSMGRPVRVNVGSRTVYVCCQGCVETLRANPSKYL